jgi:hypothetical protein
MAEPTQIEVMPKVLIQEALPTIIAPGSSAEFAKAMRQKVNEAGWREGLRITAESPIDKLALATKIEDIGVTRDAAGKKARSVEEAARYDGAKSSAKIAIDFLEKGLNNPDLTPAERKIIINKLSYDILVSTALRPALAKELQGMTAPQRRAFAERILGDPALSAEARAVLDDIIQSKEGFVDPSEAQLEFEQKKLEREEKKTELDEVTERLNKKLQELKAYERTLTSTGPKAKRIDELKTKIPILQAEAIKYERDIAMADSDYSRLDREYNEAVKGKGSRPAADIAAEMKKIESDRNTYQDEFNKRAAEIQELDVLQKDEVKLTQDRRDIQKERNQGDIAVKKAELEVRVAQQKMEDLLNARGIQETNLAERLNGIFAEATGRYIDKQIDPLSEQFDKQVEEMKAKSKTQQEKDMLDALRDTMHRTVRVRRYGIVGEQETRRPLDRARVNEYWGHLMTGGPDQMMARLLMTRRNPTTGVNYTQVEAEGIVQQGVDDEIKQQLLKQMVANKVLVGGIRQEDAHQIVNSPWGKDLIDQGLQQNTQFRQELERLFGAEAVSNPRYRERLAQEMTRRSNLWWLLAGIVGLPIAAAIRAGRAENVFV